MKVNEPLTPEDRQRADREYKKLAQDQRVMLESIAARLEDGEALAEWERALAAAAIRHAAGRIPTTRPRPPGRPAQVPEGALLEWQILIMTGHTTASAEAELAARYGVDVETLHQRLTRMKRKESAQAWGLARWGARGRPK